MFEMKRCDFPLGPVCLKDGWVLVRGQPNPAGPGPTGPESQEGVLMAFPPHQPRTCPCSVPPLTEQKDCFLRHCELLGQVHPPFFTTGLLLFWTCLEWRETDPRFCPLGWDHPPSSPRVPVDSQMAQESIWGAIRRL